MKIYVFKMPRFISGFIKGIRNMFSRPNK
ncbi:MAG TPA: stage V sporulation protein M [Thermoanaerobacterales bacterium]|nr:stage V sporulation protein M [Thermoanaerobacterales bacterium]